MAFDPKYGTFHQQDARKMEVSVKRGKYRTPYANGRARGSGYARKGRRYAGAYRRGRQYPAPRRRSYRRNTATMGFLGIETKFYDTNLNAAAITAPTDSAGGEHDPSATSMISTPVRGDSEENRDGKQIMIKNCTIKGSINIPTAELAANSLTASIVYVALVLDTQTNGAQLNSEDVYKNTGATALTAACPHKNLLFMNRFRILKSQKFDMTPQTLSHFAVDSFSYNGKTRVFSWFVPLDLKVNFNAGTTASVANVIDNSLHIIAYCTNTAGVPTLSYNARIRFVG